MSSRTTACLIAALLIPLMLTGCLPGGQTTETPVTPESSPAQESLATPDPADTVPTDSGPVDSSPVNDGGRPHFWEDDIYSTVQEPLDQGSIKYATGTTTSDDSAVPLSYEVAVGDNFEFIAKRFDLGTAYLVSINAVRRESRELFVGDVINLRAETITSIGDQNGTAYDHLDRLPEPHVMQR